MLLALTLALAVQNGRPAPLIDRDRPLRPSLPVPTEQRTAASPSVASEGSETPIRRIVFTGAKAPAPVAAAGKPFLGKPATIATLKALAAQLSIAYADTEAALYNVSIPQQDFADGVVTVALTEGRITEAVVRAPEGAHPLLRSRMAPLLDEAPLSSATLARQFALMRAIPGMTLTAEMNDADGDGRMALVVTPKQRRTRVTAGFTNRGVDLLGAGQFDVKGEAYGALVDGDQVTVQAAAAVDLEQFRYVGGSYAAPLSASGVTATGAVALLQTRPDRVPITGEALQASLGASYPWLRDDAHAGDLSLGIDATNSDNAVLGNLVARERIRAVRGAASWSVATARRSLAVSLSAASGLDVLGADTAAGDADVGFGKLSAAVAGAQALGRRWTLRANAQGQWSGDRLPAVERFTAGGEAFGRAFDVALLSGDRGAGGLVEMAWRPLSGGSFATSELYTFADGALVGVHARAVAPGGTYSLASAGVGARMRVRDKAELGVEAARTLDDPYPGYDEDWRLSVAWRLSL